jgi:dimethylglycine dehydrogenase
VTTDKGEISCRHVISATGNFARQTGAMVGLDIPVIPVEHINLYRQPNSIPQSWAARQGLPDKIVCCAESLS